jgi:hypothetical protein
MFVRLRVIEYPSNFRRKDKNRAGVIQPQEEENESAERSIDGRRGLGVLEIYPESPF